MTKARTALPAGFPMCTWPVMKQAEEGPVMCPGPGLLCSLPLQDVRQGACPNTKACGQPYLWYLSLLPAILWVSKVKESVIRAAGGGGGADFGRGPSSIPTQLPSVQQFEVPPL